MSHSLARPRIAALAVFCLSALLSACASQDGHPSMSYLDSLKPAEPDLLSVPDGSYSAKVSVKVPFGSFAALPWAEVSVKIVGHAYSSVVLTAPSALVGDERFRAFGARIVSENSVLVDSVSGATFTSRAMQRAVAEAVKR